MKNQKIVLSESEITAERVAPESFVLLKFGETAYTKGNEQGSYSITKDDAQRILDDFKKRGKTIILVTHNMPVVQEICDSVTWLNQGTMMKTGPAAEVIKAYRKSLD
jgi:ABC-type arginine transport system ATPase subunit